MHPVARPSGRKPPGAQPPGSRPRETHRRRDNRRRRGEPRGAKCASPQQKHHDSYDDFELCKVCMALLIAPDRARNADRPLRPRHQGVHQGGASPPGAARRASRLGRPHVIQARKPAPRLAVLRIDGPQHQGAARPAPPHPPAHPPHADHAPACPGAWVPSHTPSRAHLDQERPPHGPGRFPSCYDSSPEFFDAPDSAVSPPARPQAAPPPALRTERPVIDTRGLAECGTTLYTSCQVGIRPGRT